MPPKVVVLVSGGIDSAVLLRQSSTANDVTPLFVHYGQRSGAAEQAAAEAQCAAVGLPLLQLDIASVGRAFQAGQARKAHSPLPHRNLIVSSLAMSYATQIGAKSIALAVIRDDTDWYPSASHGFVHAFRAVLATLGEVTLETPLITLDKRAVIVEGARLGVDFSRTYSCMLGHAQHCGRCRQCQSRRAAFASAELTEAEGFYRDA